MYWRKHNILFAAAILMLENLGVGVRVQRSNHRKWSHRTQRFGRFCRRNWENGGRRRAEPKTKIHINKKRRWQMINRRGGVCRAAGPQADTPSHQTQNHKPPRAWTAWRSVGEGWKQGSVPTDSRREEKQRVCVCFLILFTAAACVFPNPPSATGWAARSTATIRRSIFVTVGVQKVQRAAVGLQLRPAAHICPATTKSELEVEKKEKPTKSFILSSWDHELMCTNFHRSIWFLFCGSLFICSWCFLVCLVYSCYAGLLCSFRLLLSDFIILSWQHFVVFSALTCLMQVEPSHTVLGQIWPFSTLYSKN